MFHHVNICIPYFLLFHENIKCLSREKKSSRFNYLYILASFVSSVLVQLESFSFYLFVIISSHPIINYQVYVIR